MKTMRLVLLFCMFTAARANAEPVLFEARSAVYDVTPQNLFVLVLSDQPDICDLYRRGIARAESTSFGLQAVALQGTQRTRLTDGHFAILPPAQLPGHGSEPADVDRFAFGGVNFSDAACESVQVLTAAQGEITLSGMPGEVVEVSIRAALHHATTTLNYEAAVQATHCPNFWRIDEPLTCQ